MLQGALYVARPGMLVPYICHFPALSSCLSQFAEERGCDPQEILLNETLETLSCMLPGG